MGGVQVNTGDFDERNFAKSRAVIDAMDAAAGTDMRALTQRERKILDMWPRFEDTGETVMVEVTARCCGSELNFDAPAACAPRIGDVATVTVEWGEGE